MNYDDYICKNIREVRLEKNLSQEKLAKICGFSNTTLSAYENRRKIPNISTIAKIAKALDVSIERLYYGDENTAFINSEPDIGKRVVNSVYFLWSEGIISYYERFSYGFNPMMESDSNGPGGVFLYIHKYSPQIKRLISSLKEFNERKTTYTDPDNFLKMLLSSVANEINNEIDREKKKEKIPKVAKKES